MSNKKLIFLIIIVVVIIILGGVTYFMIGSKNHIPVKNNNSPSITTPISTTKVNNEVNDDTTTQIQNKLNALDTNSGTGTETDLNSIDKEINNL